MFTVRLVDIDALVEQPVQSFLRVRKLACNRSVITVPLAKVLKHLLKYQVSFSLDIKSKFGQKLENIKRFDVSYSKDI